MAGARTGDRRAKNQLRSLAAMEEMIGQIFGVGNDLTVWQMSCRGVGSFFTALILIRISGRRSFGLRMPVDNIVVVLLGAILSRGVVGASPFGPVLVTCLFIVVLHRMFGWFASRYPAFGHFAEGRRFILYENGRYYEGNMSAMQVSKEDMDAKRK